jgi:hypothetical protein
MSFDNFPTGLPSIDKALATLLSDQIGPPPDIRSIGQRTYQAFVSSKANLDLIATRDWRHVPYAIWLNDGGLVNMPNAIDQYLNKELPKSVSTSRRPLKWARPLAFIYIERYDPSDSLFRKISAHTKYVFESKQLDNSSKIVDFFRQTNLFDVDAGPKKVAISIATSKQTLKEWIKTHDLWESFGTSPFTEAAFSEFLTSDDDFRRSSEFINTVFEWAISDTLTLRHPALRPKVAEALLLPWRSGSPSEWSKNRIITFLLKHYGDPRLSKNLWHGVNSNAVSVFISWINERTLELFFKILKDTADIIWEYRQKFWMAYFKAKHIDEVWFALGPRAALALKKYDSAGQLKYANLAGSDSTQSVLFIRIGQLLFCEWSHDGKLRAQRVDASTAPRMYERHYESDELRFESMDFNNNQNQDPGLIHFSSQNGGWQERARIFIQKNTGIRMTQGEVM